LESATLSMVPPCQTYLRMTFSEGVSASM